jgi:hypothetical protein
VERHDGEVARAASRGIFGDAARCAPVSARAKGFVLAMATLIVNALGLALSFDVDPFACGGNCSDAVTTVSLFMEFATAAFIPCVLAGLLLGWAAGESAHAPPWARWLVLALPAAGFVLVLAAGAKLLDFALLSMLPTLAAVTALERWTRAPREIPVARAR